MSDIYWNITSDEVEKACSDKFYTELTAWSIDKVNKIARNMQYLSSHDLNKTLTANEKIAYFNSYEKSRMDFLADIATATPTMENSKLFYGELLAGIDKNRILLDRISGIDNFKYQIKLHDLRHCDKNECFQKEVSLENDFTIAIPNDILGQHAFYIIIENVLRNTAKHSSRQGDDLVTFHIEVHEPDKSVCEDCPELQGYYEIQIYDAIDIAQKDEVFKDEDKKFFKEHGLEKIGETPINRLATIDSLAKIVYRQNMYINQPLLDKESKLRQSAWGMIEMEAAAAYLRKIPVQNIDNTEYDLQINDLYGKDYNIGNNNRTAANILKAFIKETKVDGAYKKRHLAYRFFMLKPKEILVILDNESSSLAGLSTSFVNYGIWLKYNDDRIAGIEKLDDKVCEHEILLNLTNEKIESVIGVLPDRIINPDKRDRLKWIQKLAKVNGKGALPAKRFKEEVWIDFRKQISNVLINNCFYPNSGESLSFGPIEPPYIIANFDHHGSSWNSTLLPEFLNDQIQYLEVTGGLNNLTDVLRKAAYKRALSGSKVHHIRDETTYSKLLNSIDAQVIVIDERIQEAAFSLRYQPEAENSKSILFNDLYIASGIYIPHPKYDFNFSRISYIPKNGEKSARESLKCTLSKIGSVFFSKDNKRNFNRVRFLVIHLGVLEKILNAEGNRENDPEKEKGAIKKLVEELKMVLPAPLRESVKPIIISGRGLPPNLPHEIPYVSYSAISQYMVDNRSKYLLTELLFSTRRINRNE